MPAVDFGTGKSVFVLAIVVGCFAVLWPRIFYPMLQASVNPYGEEECCSVLSEKDVNVARLLRELCNVALKRHEETYQNAKPIQRDKMTKQVIDICRADVLQACGIDITILLQENPAISKKYMAVVTEMRSFNVTQCIKDQFGLESILIGGPRRARSRIENPQHMRPERPPHVRPEMMHPALREKGRAIPQRTIEKEAKPGPLPGVRPPLGGAGHMMAPPKGSGTMGVVMPLYTIGIVIFFVYTIMKVLLRKPDPNDVEEKEYPETTQEYTSTAYAADQGEYVYSHYRIKEQQRLEQQQRNKRKGFGNEIPQTKLGVRATHPSNESVKVKVDEKVDGKENGDIVSTAPVENIEGESLGYKERDAIVAAVRGLLEAVDQDIDRISEGKTKNKKDEPEGDNDPNISTPQTETLPEQTDKPKVRDDVITSEISSIPSQDKVRFSDETTENDLSKATQAACEVVDQVILEGQSHVASLNSQSSMKGHSRQGSNDSSKVAVVGVEFTAGLGSGRKWSPCASPTPPPRSFTPTPQHSKEDVGPVQSIFLEGILPSSTTQLMVSESACEELPDDDNTDETTPVILSGKMTLSVMGMELSAPSNPTVSISSLSGAPIHHSELEEQERLRELESAMKDDNGNKRSSKASSPDIEDYEVVGQGTQGSTAIEDDRTAYATAMSTGTTGNTTANLTGAEETAADVSVGGVLGDIDEHEDDRDVPEDLPEDATEPEPKEEDEYAEEEIEIQQHEDEHQETSNTATMNGTLGTPIVGSIETLDSAVSPGPSDFTASPPPAVSASSSINNFEIISSSVNGGSSFERLSVNGLSQPSTPLSPPPGLPLQQNNSEDEGVEEDNDET